MEFFLSSFDVDLLDEFFKKKHSIDIRIFLIELREFLFSVENIARTEDPFEVSHLRIRALVCNGDALFYLIFADCSKKYGKIIRRKFGLNGLENIALLFKFSVSIDKICLFVSGNLF